MRITLCNEEGDIILKTEWDAVPRAGDTICLNHATSPGYSRTKHEVLRVWWSVSAITEEIMTSMEMGRGGPRVVKDIGTHVEVYLRKL